MKKHFSRLALLLLLAIPTSFYAQLKEITLEDIWGGTFRMQYMYSLHPMENGKEYTVINRDGTDGGTDIDLYDYRSGEKVKTILGSSSIEGIDRFVSYEFSPSENKILLATQLESVFRHSTLGTYYVYDVASGKVDLLYDKAVQEPTFSPDGNKVAFGYMNNLYVKDLNSGVVTQITTDGVKNSIINGITDWVYEEEFAFVRAFDWSKDGKKIAFIRFDESKVPEFSMNVYDDKLYPEVETFKYPKAGEANSDISVHIYELSSKVTKEVDLSAFNHYYIPRIMWTEDPNVLSVQGTNRHQNELDLIFVNANDLTSKLVHQEKDKAYVDVTDDLTFLNDNSFIWTSEKSGWNHIYHYSREGKLIDQITDGPWDVTSYYGFDPKTGRIYFQSTENGSINRDVYSISRTGKNKVRLTQETGTNSASFSSDFSYFINTFSSAEKPYTFTLHDGSNGKPLREIMNNDGLENNLSGYTMSKKEFSTIEVNGETLNMYTIKPKDFDPNKEYPLFLYQYSGPGSQSVANRWGGANDYWHQMLAQDDIIIVCVDGRGTGYKGRDFKKMTQLELGKYEVQDQIAVAKKLGSLPYIDEDRMGIWGWSYGGFMAANCLFQGADTFSMAIAVAPVTSWRFYDTIYTERYMTTPQENPSGYDNNSPLSHVDKLEGDFLLVHGSADDNVHFQNTMRLSEALIQANKDFDWLVYPDDDHGIYGGYTRLHLYRKMTKFIKDHLGTTEPATLEIKN